MATRPSKQPAPGATAKTDTTPDALFASLVEQVCERIGIADPAPIRAGSPLRLGGRQLSFLHDGKAWAEQVFVYVDLGPLAAERREDACQTLLTINFELLAGVRGVLSLHPHTSHLFYSSLYPLNAAASGQDLLHTLERMLDQLGLSMSASALDRRA